MGGDYIAVTRPSHTWETGRGNYLHYAHSPKSVICTLHLSPGCYGRQECRAVNQLVFLQSHLCVDTCTHAIWRFPLSRARLSPVKWHSDKTPQNKVLIPCYYTALSTAVYLPHLVFFFYGRIDCVAFEAQRSMQDES